jgi:hypothetical protein
MMLENTHQFRTSSENKEEEFSAAIFHFDITQPQRGEKVKLDDRIHFRR